MHYLRGVLDLVERGRIRVRWFGTFFNSKFKRPGGVRSSELASHKTLFQLPRAFSLPYTLSLLSLPLSP
jgi:hypothetical protein